MGAEKEKQTDTTSVEAARYWDWNYPTEERLDFPTLPRPAAPSALGKTSSAGEEHQPRCDCSNSYSGGEMSCPIAA